MSTGRTLGRDDTAHLAARSPPLPLLLSSPLSPKRRSHSAVAGDDDVLVICVGRHPASAGDEREIGEPYDVANAGRTSMDVARPCRDDTAFHYPALLPKLSVAVIEAAWLLSHRRR